jgi:hypothetical protein
MTIGITPEAVERIVIKISDDIVEKALIAFDECKAPISDLGDFEAMRCALSAAITASQAETAAAYEAAAKVYIDGGWPWHSGAYDAIRALTPADSKAALERMIAEARADGMREAAALCAVVRDTAKNTILAAIPKGTSHE